MNNSENPIDYEAKLKIIVEYLNRDEDTKYYSMLFVQQYFTWQSDETKTLIVDYIFFSNVILKQLIGMELNNKFFETPKNIDKANLLNEWVLQVQNLIETKEITPNDLDVCWKEALVESEAFKV